MKIQYASDLHLEFQDNKKFIEMNPLVPVGDILILAGDIIPFSKMEFADDFFQFCSDNFETTYWIPGNHEYYNGTLENRTGQFIENIKSNVHLVNNYWAHHGNTRIILSTLWTPISSEKAWHIQNGLNDYRVISDGVKRFTTQRSTELFTENLLFIKEAVKNNERENCIIVTHHVPTFQHYPEEYKDSILNEGFAVELNDFILESDIDFWIYGHHHRNIERFKIGNTELLTNQLGYISSFENKKFNHSNYLKTK